MAGDPGGAVVTSAELTEGKGREPGSGPGATRLHVSRRALFARDLSVWGYELMWPGGSARSGTRAAGESAEHGLGAEVALLNALAELGVKPLVADKVAVISVARDTLLGRLPLPTSEGAVLVLRIDSGNSV